MKISGSAHVFYSFIKHNWACHYLFEPKHGKTTICVSDPVRHRPSCTLTEDAYKLEVSDLGRGGMILSV